MYVCIYKTLIVCEGGSEAPKTPNISSQAISPRPHLGTDGSEASEHGDEARSGPGDLASLTVLEESTGAGLLLGEVPIVVGAGHAAGRAVHH